MKKTFLAILMIFPVLLVFQNCSDGQRFSSSPSKSSESSNLQEGPANLTNDDGSTNNSNEVSQTIDEDNLNTNTTLEENDEEETPDNVISEETNKDEEVSFANCQTFIEISPNQDGVMNLPTRMPNDTTCYFKQILQEVPSHKSGSMGEIRSSEVLASDHNGNFNEYIAPYVLGDSKVKFDNLPGWKIAISGAYNDPKQQIAIDNFYLVDFQYGQSPNRVQIASAFGTKDAEPGSGAMPILYKSLELAYTHYANGGTALVDAIELSPGENIAKSYSGVYDLRIQALDCGGSAQGTDVFLVFH